MNRRHFLLSSAIAFSTTYLGFPRLSRAFVNMAKKPVHDPQLALIIDDIGFSRQAVRWFLDLQIPLTFSILPRLSLSARLAQQIHGLGHEVMLHQPMEPLQSDIDPGPGAVYVEDDAQRIARIMEENIASLPHITGANNHMGSRFTQDPDKINQALAAIGRRDLYFVDSLTTVRSQAYHTACNLHMAALQRDFFLDRTPSPEAVFMQLCRLKRRACGQGHAIGIGHPRPETALGLQRFIRSNAHSGVRLVYVSSLTLHARP